MGFPRSRGPGEGKTAGKAHLPSLPLRRIGGSFVGGEIEFELAADGSEFPPRPLVVKSRSFLQQFSGWGGFWGRRRRYAESLKHARVHHGARRESKALKGQLHRFAQEVLVVWVENYVLGKVQPGLPL